MSQNTKSDVGTRSDVNTVWRWYIRILSDPASDQRDTKFGTFLMMVETHCDKPFFLSRCWTLSPSPPGAVAWWRYGVDPPKRVAVAGWLSVGATSAQLWSAKAWGTRAVGASVRTVMPVAWSSQTAGNRAKRRECIQKERHPVYSL